MKTCNIKILNREYNNYYLIESLSEYKDYLTELNNKFWVSEKEIKELKTFMGHGHSMLTGIAGMFCGMQNDINEREPMLLHLKSLHGMVLANQVQDLLDGKKLAINTNGGYFPIKPDDEYTLEIIDEKHLYTAKDIKIKKWLGGVHHYAKIGNIDVIDDNGNMKWNTNERAHEEALKYINKLNT